MGTERRSTTMRLSAGIKALAVTAAFCVLPYAQVRAQADIVRSEGITTPLHQANVGRLAFVRRHVPADSLNPADLLQTFELKGAGDLAMRAFLANSLTNYLHRLAPQLSADELAARGRYQVSFFVDGALVYKHNVHPAAIPAETKHTKTVFAATIMNSATPDAAWGSIWHSFLIYGGDQALTAGKHRLRVELRPYLQTSELKIGDLIAAGELQLGVTKPRVDEKAAAIQPIMPGSGWTVSSAAYDRKKISELKRKIAEGLYKDIKSVVVI